MNRRVLVEKMTAVAIVLVATLSDVGSVCTFRVGPEHMDRRESKNGGNAPRFPVPADRISHHLGDRFVCIAHRHKQRAQQI